MNKAFIIGFKVNDSQKAQQKVTLKTVPTLFFELTTYQETVTLLGVYLHLNHQLLQQWDRVEWRLWASPPSCDQNTGKRSSWAGPSYGLSESHRSSQSVASEKVVLVNKLSTQRELSWKSQCRNYLLRPKIFTMALKQGNYMNRLWQ